MGRAVGEGHESVRIRWSWGREEGGDLRTGMSLEDPRGGTGLTSAPAATGVRLPRGKKGTGPCLALVESLLARPINGVGGGPATVGLLL